MSRLHLTIIAAVHIWSAGAGPLPNAQLTPGVNNPAVTEENIQETICVQGWTHTVRPPAAYTNALKRKQIDQYHYQDKKLSSYEEDHFIPLELGGHPRDPRNLWPQQYHIACGARTKDVIGSKPKIHGVPRRDDVSGRARGNCHRLGGHL